MCDDRSEDLTLWVEDFLRKRRYSKYELELAGNTAKGDGYLGEVMFVKVLTGIGREEEKIYNLVIKSAKRSDELRKKVPLREVFKREMFMYNTVFPAYRSFQLERGVEQPFMKFAKCYSVFEENRREAIILQNLRYLEYEIHDRKTAQNLNHALLVFRNYAKFHAISMAIKRQRPDLYARLTGDMTDLMAIFLIEGDMVGCVTESIQHSLDLIKNEEPVTYKKLCHFNTEFVKNVLRKVKDPKDGLSAILHGDCWNNNMMFMYKDQLKKKPHDMMFLDFQLSSVGSPIYDLSYYLYAVADERVLAYHDLLLQTYHHSLMSFLEELGETSYDFTLADIKKHWIEYGKFGIVMAPFIIKIELSEADEVIDLAECAEDGTIKDSLSFQVKNLDAYKARIKAVLKHFASLL